MTTTRRSFVVVRLLPLFHLCASLIMLGLWPDLGVLFTVIDFPISIAILTLAWRFDINLALGFGVLGTLWWYLLSLLVVKLKLRESKGSTPGEASPLSR